MTTSPLKTLANYLAGEFENKAQAAAEPSWYVHLRLWQRPIPTLSASDTFTMFLEQTSPVSDKPPYRQRVLQLTEQAGQLQGEYFALTDPLQFRGAGTQPELLNIMQADDLVSLPNSTAQIQYQSVGAASYQFQAGLPEGKFCSFEYGGQRKYVYLGFDIEKKPSTVEHSVLELKTYDKGINPDTGQGLWGALMGPFILLKQDSYRWN